MLSGVLRAQDPSLTDHLPSPQVLIPRTTMVPADADYTAVTPRMMKPIVPLRADSGISASSAAASSGDSATAAKKPKRNDSSMASAYDAAPEPAASSAASAAGNKKTASDGSVASRSGSSGASLAKKNNSDVATPSTASAPSGASPVDNLFPGGDAALMDSMGSDLHLEGKGPLVITDTDTPPPSSASAAASASGKTASSDDATRMRAAIPAVAGAQPNFRATLPPIRAARPPDPDYYNIKGGPALVRLSAGLRSEFNDNIDLSHTDKRWDFGVTPTTGLNLKIPLTVVNGVTMNAITLDLGLEYTYWMRSASSFSPLSTLNMAPGSSLAFSIMAGDDVVITLFDNFSFQSNPIDVADVQGVNAFEVFDNSIGFNAAWDLGVMTVNAGYGYGTTIHPQSEFSNLDDTSHNFSLAGTFQLTESTSLGAGGTLSRFDFTDSARDGYWTMSVGPFLSHRISEFMSVDLSVGFTQYMFDTETNPGTGIYYGAGFRHRLNSAFSYSINATRNSVVGTTSDFLDTTTLAFRPSYDILPTWTVGSDFFYQNAHAVGNGGGETLDRYGIGFGLSHAFGPRLTGSASYRYTWKDSSVQANEYQQNQLIFSVDYAF